MSRRLRHHGFAILLAAGAILILLALALAQWQWTDYDAEARPAFDALIGGHFSQFLHLAPAYGGSLLIRGPFVLATKLWGGGQLAVYRAAALPCLVAAGGLGVWLSARLQDVERARWAGALVVLICLANPITLSAFRYGHPEELLGGVLCVAAVLAARRDRPLWAGALLGLAIANKEWALVAVGPVFIALPAHRPRAMVTAAAVAGAVLAPFLLAGSAAAGTSVGSGAATTGGISNPEQLWWFFGTHSRPVLNLSGAVMVGYRSPPAWAGAIARPAIVLVPIALTLLCLYLRRGGRRRPAHEALLLLTLVLLLRFILDPWDISYYAVPFLLALVTWETVAHRRLPVLSLVGSFATWFALEEAPSLQLSPDLQSLVFLVVAVPAALGLATALYVPGVGERARARWSRTGGLHEPQEHLLPGSRAIAGT